MTVGMDVKRTILWIVTKIVTLKAFGEGRCGSMADGNMNDLSGGRKDSGTIGERLEKESIKSENILINSSIFRLGFHSGGGSSARGRRGRGEERQEGGWRRDGLRQGRNRDRRWRYACRELSLFQV